MHRHECGAGDARALAAAFFAAAGFVRKSLRLSGFGWDSSGIQEIAARELGIEAAAKLMRLIDILGRIRGAIQLVAPSFRFHAIPLDPDDDKFAHCAIVADADYVITEDKHFRGLAGVGYKPQPISPQDFVSRFL